MTFREYMTSKPIKCMVSKVTDSICSIIEKELKNKKNIELQEEYKKWQVENNENNEQR
jgi:hypothetical protein